MKNTFDAAMNGFYGFNDFKLAAAGVGMTLLLGGCSNLLTPIGENTYDCNRKENPASPYCHSFKSVEASTTGSIPASRYDETMRLSDFDQMTGIAPVPRQPISVKAEPLPSRGEAMSPGRDALPSRTPAPGAPMAAVAPLAPAPSLEGLPVREGPVVQRIWVKRFVDGNDLLVGETVIYKEIISSHWQGFGAPNPTTAGSTWDAGLYPHRPPAAKPMVGAMTPIDRNATARGGAADAPTNPPTPGFAQPGARAQESSGMAPVPATSSGTTSMPQ